MKKRLFVKTFSLVLFGLLVIAYPAKLCINSLVRYKQYNDLCYGGDVVLDIENQEQIVRFFYFIGDNSQKNAGDYIKTIANTEGYKSSHIFNTNADLITQIFIGVDDLEYETVIETVAGRGEGFYRTLNVKNAEGIDISHEAVWEENSIDVRSYELPEMLAENDYLECKEGRYPDFNLEYETGDTVEIMVTDGIGLDAGDKCFIALDALDENNELVVVKAEVVGIASKGIFLPYYKGYFSGDATNVENAYKRVFNDEMIYYPDLSSMYQYNFRFTPDERGYCNNTTVAMVLMERGNTETIIENVGSFNGELINFGKVNMYNFRYFADYSDLGFAENLSIAQRELYLSVSLIVFMLFFVVVIILKIISMLKEYKNTVKGEE